MDTPRKRILLALDGSGTSLETVRYVAKIFPVARTEVVLFHVAANIPGIFWHIGEEFRDRIAPARAWVHETHRAMSAFMHAAAHELTHAGFSPDTVTVKIERQQNSIVRDIAAEAACDYDAVVVSRQGLSRTKDTLIGKTGNQLMKRLRNLPIIVVSGSPTTQKIMIAMDSTDDASRGVTCVGHLLAETPTRIMLCHAIRSRMMYYLPANLYDAEDQDESWATRSRKHIDPWIKKAQGRLIEAGVAPERISVSILEDCTSRATSLLEEARNTGIGTIVAGRRHLPALESWLLGSVSRQLVNWARGMAVWVAA
jgi:nucleotide-binding universal stress UspA family protein